MSGKKQRQSTESEAARVAAEVRAALVQLAEASDRAHSVMNEARAFFEGIGQTAPVGLRLVGTGAATSTTDEVGLPGDVLPSPHWDPCCRVLRVGQHIVKRYRLSSPNQAAILAAFEEEGWPTSIDDPLSPVPGLCSKQRLHDTIKSLNAHQEHRLIRFRGDGTGQRVCCELIDEESATLVAGMDRLRRAA